MGCWTRRRLLWLLGTFAVLGLRRRLVADVTFDRPTVVINLRQVRAEAAGDVPLEERGWQEALEALALDLKINQLRILGGRVTYVDAGPYKPLQISRLNATAENIRNIRSRERVYPSDLHVDAVVFDTGQVWLDGRADFLASRILAWMSRCAWTTCSSTTSSRSGGYPAPALE